jgi:phosphoribosylaminoimidazole-succinocarboxamide synthase
MGSVKDLAVLEEPSNHHTGRGRFIFSDRYSVFDWGEMPDHIPNKGKAICIATAYFFERLKGKKIKTHYLGLVEDRKVKSLDQLEAPSNTMEVELVRVLKPRFENGAYDYSVYREERVNFLIPLEVIYRNSLPPGSSVFKRLESGSLTLAEMGLTEPPRPGQVLDKPLLDFSSKLESSDRYLSREEAKALGHLSEEELGEIEMTTLLANNLISAEAARLGLLNEDGKMEFAFDAERKLMLVDALGTLDECRFTFEDLAVSKEIARIFYRETDWFRETEKAKSEGGANWKGLVKSTPPPLPAELLQAISDIYMAYANEITGKEFFDAPPLRQSLQTVKKYLKST